MNSKLLEEKAREETKRNRMYDPDQRWKDIRDAIRLVKAERLRRSGPQMHLSDKQET